MHTHAQTYTTYKTVRAIYSYHIHVEVVFKVAVKNCFEGHIAYVTYSDEGQLRSVMGPGQPPGPLCSALVAPDTFASVSQLYNSCFVDCLRLCLFQTHI